MQLILISGKKRTGKSTLQNALHKYINNTTRNTAVMANFADEIYKMHNYALKRLHDLGIANSVSKDRKLLQFLGTEWARKSFGENIWCEVMRKKLNYFEHVHHDYTIISDCRFKNEFDYFPEALRVRLVSSLDTRKSRSNENWNEVQEMHQSETDLDLYSAMNKFDLVLCTETFSVHECVQKVLETLKTNWIEKRT